MVYRRVVLVAVLVLACAFALPGTALGAPVANPDPSPAATSSLPLTTNYAVDFDGTRLAVGGGGVWVYRKSGTGWVQEAAFAGSSHFGRCIDIDGDTLVAGTRGQGAVLVYHRSSSGWASEAVLVADAGSGDTSFGEDVALDHDRLAVTCMNGATYYFTRSSTGVWTRQQRIAPPDPGSDDWYGNSAALAGNTLLVGAPMSGAHGFGTTFVYSLTGSSWSLTQRLEAPVLAYTGMFGTDMSTDGTTAVIGAPGGNGYSGAAWIYSKVDGRFTKAVHVSPPDPHAWAMFGNNVALSGDRVVVSRDDAAYSYRRSGSGWVAGQKLPYCELAGAVFGDQAYFATGSMADLSGDYDVAVDGTLSVQAPGVLGNDASPTGGATTAALVTPPSHGVATLSPDGSFTYVPSGSWTGTDMFAYRASDASGSSDPTTVSISVQIPSTASLDVTPPTVSLIAPTPSAGSDVSGSVPIACSVGDTESGVAYEEWVVDGQQLYKGSTSAIWDTTSWSGGPHEVGVWVYDRAGNHSYASTTVNVLATPITLVSSNPGPYWYGWYNAWTTVQLAVSNVPTGSIYCGWDGASLKPYAGAMVASEGVHTLSYRTVGATSAEATKSTTFQVDSIPPVAPTVTVASVTSTSVTFTESGATDSGSGILETDWYLSSGQTLNAMNKTTATVSGLAPGATASVYVDVYDYAANRARSAVVSWTTLVPPVTSASVVGTVSASGWYRATPSVALATVPSASPIRYHWDSAAETTYTSALTPAEGVHTLTFHGIGADGTTEVNRTLTLNVDTVAPSAPALGVASLTTSSVSFSASGTVERGSGLAYYALYAPSGSLLATSSDGSFRISGLGEGVAVQGYACAFDVAGNRSPATGLVTATTLASPVTTATVTGAIGSSGWYTTTPAVSLAASPTDSTIRYRWDSDPDATYTSSLAAVEGVHTLTYYSVGTNGVVEGAKNAPFKVDTVPPSARITSPTGGTSLTGLVQIAGSGSDVGSGLTRLEVRVDGSLLATTASSAATATWDSRWAPNGAHTISLIAYDAAGNVATASINVTSTAPTIVTNQIGKKYGDSVSDTYLYLMSSTSNFNSAATMLVGETATLGQERSLLRFPLAKLAGGGDVSIAKLHLTRASGASSYFPLRVYRLKRSPVFAEASWSYYKAGTPWTSAGAGGADSDYIASPYCDGSDPTAFDVTSLARAALADGSSTLDLLLVDPSPTAGRYMGFSTSEASNADAQPWLETTSFNYPASVTDTTAPTVAFTSPAEGASASGTVPLTVLAADSGSGVARVDYAVDGTALTSVSSAPYSASWNATAAAYGAHTITATCYDVAGNSSVATVHVNVPDTTAPTVALAAPAAGATVTGTVALAASAADSGSGLARVEFRVDGTLLASDVTAPYGATWDASAAGPGAHTIEARAIDAAGNAATSSVSVTVPAPADSTPPAVSLTAPAEGASVSGATALTALASDTGSGVARVDFRVDGTLVGSATSAPYSASWNAVAYGAHTIVATAYDAAGNSAVSTVHVTVPDATPPTVGITSPADGATATGTVTIGATASDAGSGIARVVFAVDGATIATAASAPYSASWNAGAASLGAHTITATAFDAAGNSSAATVHVTVPDVTPPTVAITSPTAGATLSGTAILSANAADAGSGMARVVFAVDGSTLATVTSSPYSVVWNAGAASAGSHTIAAAAYDVAGNVSSASISVTVQGSGSQTTTGTVSIGKKYGDAVSDTYLYLMSSTSNFNSAATMLVGETATLGQERSLLRFPLAKLAGGAVSTATLHLTRASGATSYFTIRAYRLKRSPVFAEASWSYYKAGTPWTSAGAGGADSDYIASSYCDSANPAAFDVTSLAKAAAADGSSNLDLMLVDPSLSAGRYMGFSTSEASNADAQPWLEVTTSVTTSAAPDTTAPTIAFTSPAEGASASGTVPLTVLAADSGSGVARVDYAVDGTALTSVSSAPYSASWNAAAAAYGAHTITATCYDVAGNSSVATVHVNVPDTTAPTLALTAPAAGATVTGTVALAASAADSGSGVARVEFRVDGTLLASDATAPYGATWDASAAAPGAHTIEARAIDAAGNAATSSVSVTIPAAADTTPPSVTVNAPTEGASVAGTTTLTALASDAGSGVARVEFAVDGTLVGSATSAPYSASWNAVVYGAHTIVATAYDAAGNSAVSTVHVTVPDATPPTVGITSPADGATATGTVSIAANASDSESGVARVEFRVDGTLVATAASAPYSASWNATGASYGTHTITATAFDVAGNSSMATVHVTVPDATPPSVSITAPTAGASVTGTTTLSASASDAESGVNRVVFAVDGLAVGTATSAPYSASWNAAAASVGTHTVTAVAYDAAGNSASATVSVVVPVQAPVVATYKIGKKYGDTVGDTYLYLMSSTSNFNSAATMLVGETATLGQERSLLRFPLAKLAGAGIQSAVLHLTRASGATSYFTLRAYRLKRPVVFEQASWAYWQAGSAWTASGANGAGTDYIASPYCESATPTAFDVTALARAALADGSTNLDLMIVDPNLSAGRYMGFSTSESTNADAQPWLEVTGQ